MYLTTLLITMKSINLSVFPIIHFSSGLQYLVSFHVVHITVPVQLILLLFPLVLSLLFKRISYIDISYTC